MCLSFHEAPAVSSKQPSCPKMSIATKNLWLFCATQLPTTCMMQFSSLHPQRSSLQLLMCCSSACVGPYPCGKRLAFRGEPETHRTMVVKALLHKEALCSDLLSIAEQSC